jgi:hypothetical protein
MQRFACLWEVSLATPYHQLRKKSRQAIALQRRNDYNEWMSEITWSYWIVIWRAGAGQEGREAWWVVRLWNGAGQRAWVSELWVCGLVRMVVFILLRFMRFFAL